ncbi:MAG: cob(I)yrinic acid a,c-diamide adenosyltransferase [Phyllobacteriaceae bacterium]|nr:cob(I)yrinic acid a,c-diamide adenosyltransferase [Phyllobacteriaceae bacterium]
MSLYTRGGDQGDTSLLGGVRVPKDSPRIEVYGTLDETTSTLGLARALTRFDDVVADLSQLQGEFIDVMGELASGPFDPAAAAALPRGRSFRVGPTQVARLEATIDRYQAERLPAKGFVRPGGSRAGAALDMARTFVRRAERRLVQLAREEPVNPELMKYFNRLSDLFFIMARIDEQREVAALVTAELMVATGTANGGATKMIGLETTNRMMAAGIAKANEIGVPMVLSACDGAGQLVELRRMEGSLPISLTLAPMKAHTAAAVRLPTADIGALARPDGALWGLDGNIPGVTLVGGGLPLQAGGRVVGAVGVSGGSVEQDVSVARAMVAAFAEETKGMD